MDDNSLNTPKSTPQKQHDPSGLSFSSSVFTGSFLAQLGTPQRESLNSSSSSGFRIFRRMTRSQTRNYSSNDNLGGKIRTESQESGIGTTGTELETTSTSPGLLSTSTEMSIDNFVNHLMETTSNSTPRRPGTSGGVRNSIRNNSNKENETPSLNQFTPPRVAPRPLAVAAKRRPPLFQPLSAQSSTTSEVNSILKDSRKTWSFKIIESYLPTAQDDEENNWTNFMSKLSWHPMDAQASPSFKEGEHILTCCLVRQIIIEDPQTVVLCWKGILECQHEISNRKANRILNIRPSAQNLVKYKKPGLTSAISEEDAYGNSFFKISKKSSGTGRENESSSPAPADPGPSKRHKLDHSAGRILHDDTVYKKALKKPNLTTAMNFIQQQRPKEFVFRQPTLQRSLKQHFTKLGSPSKFLLSSFSEKRIPNEILASKTVVIYGLQESGKTEFAKAHFRNPLVITRLDDLRGIHSWDEFDGLVLDEPSLDNMKEEDLIHLYDVKEERSFRINYNCLVVIPGGMRRIITTCRRHGEIKSCRILEQQKVITRRTYFLQIKRKIYGPPESDQILRENNIGPRREVGANPAAATNSVSTSTPCPRRFKSTSATPILSPVNSTALFLSELSSPSSVSGFSPTSSRASSLPSPSPSSSSSSTNSSLMMFVSTKPNNNRSTSTSSTSSEVTVATLATRLSGLKRTKMTKNQQQSR